MSERNLADLDRDIAQPLGRILQDAGEDGLVTESKISAGTFAAPNATIATALGWMIVSGNSAVDTGASATVRNFWSRCKISAAQALGGSQYGSVNQLRIASPTATGDYAMSSAGVYAGAWNVFEASDTAKDVTFTNLKAIGSHSKLEISTNHTISSGSFHGVNIGNAVIPTMASATSFAALYIEKDGGAQDWTIGVDINDCTTGIDIGAATTGVAITGATTYGINITGEAATAAINVSCATLSVAQRGLKIAGSVDVPNYGDGYGFAEIEMSITGIQAGHTSALTSWVNMSAGTGGTGGLFITAQNNGFWEDAAATITDTVIIYGMRMSCIVGDADSINYPFSLNMSGSTMKALFHCASTTDLGIVTDAGADDGTLVPLYTTDNSTIHYVKVYSHT